MDVTYLQVKNFRNIEHCEIEPCDSVNIIYGQNAQGKTNLLESIWLFTGCRSFRGSKDSELINFNSSKAILDMDFIAFDREQQAHLEICEGKKFTLNGIKKTSGQIMGNFLSVVFSPVHLSLVKDGPYERRRFLDIAISQLKPKYAVTLSNYNKAIAQRNVLLKDIAFHSELYDTLDVWEDRIAFFASEIVRQRLGYINKLSLYSQDIYNGLSSGKEKLDISYLQHTVIAGDSKQELYENIKNQLYLSRKNDLVTGSTSVGPHRDDLEIKIDRLSARNYGSQGQQRSCALSLKLSEASILRKYSGEQPIALLDDVMSELDGKRQKYLIKYFDGWQVFVTCCDRSHLRKIKSDKTFKIADGKVKK